jgi:hypothetical protein
MAKKTGSIILATVRNFTGVVPLRGRFTIQMLSANLSADTTFNLQFSLDGTNWDNAQDAGVDISDSLVQSATMIKSFDADPGILFRILFAGATTGTIAYVINGV